jgi:putative CocE/NonD family hydrolase
VAHPSYDAFWQRHALMSYATTPVVPTLTVGGWWDQEDEYGAIASYAELERHDSLNRNFLVMGPWNHGQWNADPATTLGQVQFGRSTGADFRKDIQGPWFNFWLKGTGDGAFPEAQVFDAGAKTWKSFGAWPPKEATRASLYFHADGQLRFTPPTSSTGYDQFVSDPAHPVPYRSRPVELTYDPRGSRWRTWEVEDQRFVDDRSDVLSWETEPLTEDLVVAGDVQGRLFASTTGSDADWVVKLIDVYPDSLAERPRMGGFELMVTGDVLRGRYRTSFSRPAAITPNAVLAYTVDLHQQAYQFRKGHRIMVQVQSTWFPLYDRNPQTFVPNIFLADSAAYQAQTHRIYRSARFPSHVSIMLVPQ